MLFFKIYDVSTNTWAVRTTDMLTARSARPAIVDFNNKVICFKVE